MKTKNQIELTPSVGANEKLMKTLLSAASLSLLLAAGNATAAPKPEIVLVHGAWEESNIWQAVTPLLKKDGYRMEITIDTGHTPFLTDPRGLARDIETAAKAQETATR
jgi:hypothetical protein